MLEEEMEEQNEDENLGFDIYDNLHDFDLGSEVAKLRDDKIELEKTLTLYKKEMEEKQKQNEELLLHQENLLKNISKLFLTAKSEVTRKDTKIAELNRRLDDFHFRRRGRVNMYPRDNVLVNNIDQHENIVTAVNAEVLQDNNSTMAQININAECIRTDKHAVDIVAKKAIDGKIQSEEKIHSYQERIAVDTEKEQHSNKKYDSPSEEYMKPSYPNRHQDRNWQENKNHPVSRSRERHFKDNHEDFQRNKTRTRSTHRMTSRDFDERRRSVSPVRQNDRHTVNAYGNRYNRQPNKDSRYTYRSEREKSPDRGAEYHRNVKEKEAKIDKNETKDKWRKVPESGATHTKIVVNYKDSSCKVSSIDSEDSRSCRVRSKNQERLRSYSSRYLEGKQKRLELESRSRASSTHQLNNANNDDSRRRLDRRISPKNDKETTEIIPNDNKTIISELEEGEISDDSDKVNQGTNFTRATDSCRELKSHSVYDRSIVNKVERHDVVNNSTGKNKSTPISSTQNVGFINNKSKGDRVINITDDSDSHKRSRFTKATETRGRKSHRINDNIHKGVRHNLESNKKSEFLRNSVDQNIEQHLERKNTKVSSVEDCANKKNTVDRQIEVIANNDVYNVNVHRGPRFTKATETYGEWKSRNINHESEFVRNSTEENVEKGLENKITENIIPVSKRNYEIISEKLPAQNQTNLITKEMLSLTPPNQQTDNNIFSVMVQDDELVQQNLSDIGTTKNSSEEKNKDTSDRKSPVLHLDNYRIPRKNVNSVNPLKSPEMKGRAICHRESKEKCSINKLHSEELIVAFERTDETNNTNSVDKDSNKVRKRRISSDSTDDAEIQVSRQTKKLKESNLKNKKNKVYSADRLATKEEDIKINSDNSDQKFFCLKEKNVEVIKPNIEQNNQLSSKSCSESKSNKDICKKDNKSPVNKGNKKKIITAKNKSGNIAIKKQMQAEETVLIENSVSKNPESDNVHSSAVLSELDSISKKNDNGNVENKNNEDLVILLEGNDNKTELGMADNVNGKMPEKKGKKNIKSRDKIKKVSKIVNEKINLLFDSSDMELLEIEDVHVKLSPTSANKNKIDKASKVSENKNTNFLREDNNISISKLNSKLPEIKENINGKLLPKSTNKDKTAKVSNLSENMSSLIEDKNVETINIDSKLLEVNEDVNAKLSSTSNTKSKKVSENNSLIEDDNATDIGIHSKLPDKKHNSPTKSRQKSLESNEKIEILEVIESTINTTTNDKIIISEENRKNQETGSKKNEIKVAAPKDAGSSAENPCTSTQKLNTTSSEAKLDTGNQAKPKAVIISEENRKNEETGGKNYEIKVAAPKDAGSTVENPCTNTQKLNTMISEAKQDTGNQAKPKAVINKFCEKQIETEDCSSKKKVKVDIFNTEVISDESFQLRDKSKNQEDNKENKSQNKEYLSPPQPITKELIAQERASLSTSNSQVVAQNTKSPKQSSPPSCGIIPISNDHPNVQSNLCSVPVIILGQENNITEIHCHDNPSFNNSNLERFENFVNDCQHYSSSFEEIVETNESKGVQKHLKSEESFRNDITFKNCIKDDITVTNSKVNPVPASIDKIKNLTSDVPFSNNKSIFNSSQFFGVGIKRRRIKGIKIIDK